MLNPLETPPGAVPRVRGGLPFSVLVGLMVGVGLFLSTQLQFRDVDLYWHLLAGAELARGVPADALGLQWSFAPNPSPWTSTQWLSELALHGVHRAGGWAAIAAYQSLTLATALAILAWNTLRSGPIALAAYPFLLAGVSLVVNSRERPQQFTFIGVAVLSGVLVRGLRDRTLPRWWVLLPLTVLWANLHGGWILVPAVLGLLGVGAALDGGLRDGWAARCLALVAAGAAAGALTPAGMSNLTAVLRLRSSAALISEWAPVQPTVGFGLLTVGMLVLVGLGWARSPSVPRSELLIMLALLIFGWVAWRNLPMALVLLAPVTAHRLGLAFPEVGREPEPRWAAPVGALLAVSALAFGLSGLPTRMNLPTDTLPLGLVAQLGDVAPNQRVLNDYNLAGAVLYFGAPGTTVGIDGRADRYGAEYVGDYLDLTSMRGDWRVLLEELDPTSALIRQDSPLADHLVRVRGWREIGRESGYLLLVEPNGVRGRTVPTRPGTPATSGPPTPGAPSAPRDRSPG